MKKLLAVMMLLATSAWATTWYVSPTGNDGAAGTSPATAWQTIGKVNDDLTMSAGDSLLFEAGVTHTSAVPLYASCTGTAGNRNTIGSYGSGRATIHITTGDGYNGGIGLSACSNMNITDLNLKGNSSGSPNLGALRIAESPTDNLTIRNVDIRYMTISVEMYPLTIWHNIVFDNVVLHDFALNGLSSYMDNSSHGIDNLSITNFDIHNGAVNGGGNGIALYSGSNGGQYTNLNISDGIVHDVDLDGILTWAADRTKPVANGVIIDNVEVYNIDGNNLYWDAYGHGVQISRATNVIIRNSTAHDLGSVSVDNGASTGFYSYQSDNVLFEDNRVYNIIGGVGGEGTGIMFDGGTTNSIARRNYIDNTDGSCISIGNFEAVTPTNNNVAYYNVGRNCGQGDDDGIGYTAYSIWNLVDNTALVTNNSFYNNVAYTGSQASGTKTSPFRILGKTTNSKVKNNIFISGLSHADYFTELAWIDADQTNLDIDYNVYWRSASGGFTYGWGSTIYTTLESLRAANGGQETHSIYVDPQVVSTGTPNFRIKSASPARNAGISVGLTTDYYGHTISGLPDIGASEYVAPVTILPPDDATGVSTSATFTWDPVPGASKYNLVVSTDPEFGSSVVNVETANTSYEAALSAATHYYWRIRAYQ